MDDAAAEQKKHYRSAALLVAIVGIGLLLESGARISLILTDQPIFFATWWVVFNLMMGIIYTVSAIFIFRQSFTTLQAILVVYVIESLIIVVLSIRLETSALIGTAFFRFFMLMAINSYRLKLEEATQSPDDEPYDYTNVRYILLAVIVLFFVFCGVMAWLSGR